MFAYQYWADTTTGILKQRNSANTAWISLWTIATGAWLGNAATATSATTATTATTATNQSGGTVNAVGGISRNGKLLISDTVPTVTGFGTSPAISKTNGSFAFQINVGTGGTASSGNIILPSATNGWHCIINDTVNTANMITRQTGTTTTYVQVANYLVSTGALTAWPSNVSFICLCVPY
jgi:hypothetical protein